MMKQMLSSEYGIVDLVGEILHGKARVSFTRGCSSKSLIVDATTLSPLPAATLLTDRLPQPCRDVLFWPTDVRASPIVGAVVADGDCIMTGHGLKEYEFNEFEYWQELPERVM